MGKKRKYWLVACSPFLTMFSKHFFALGHILGLTHYQMTNGLDWAKFKAIAEDKSKVAKKMISVFD